MQAPKTQYARNGEVNIAYQVVGDGPIDLALVPGFISHLDLWWTIPETTAFTRRLAAFSRLILFDKRGTGLSDPVAGLCSLEERMEDLHAVLDAVGSERPALFGISEGGPMSVLFAGTYPDRVASLVLYGTFPAVKRGTGRFSTELEDRMEVKFAELTALVDEQWGEGLAIEWFAPNLAGSPMLRRSWGLFERAAASPGMVSHCCGRIARSMYRQCCRRCACRHWSSTGRTTLRCPSKPVGRWPSTSPGRATSSYRGTITYRGSATPTWSLTRSRSS
jgi:pimeloyl-ACP methyl ester carboxylesterase